MLLIYTPSQSVRLNYIAEVLFTAVVKVDHKIINNQQDFIEFDGPKINYSNVSLSPVEIWIQPHTLLFEAGVRQQAITCFDWNGLTAFLKTEGHIAFDIFAASFYLVSRYEEYLPHTKDEYGRYAHTNSAGYQNSFLHLPLVNIWMKEFVKIIAGKFPGFTIQSSPFTFVPTYDIDIAYAYKGKGLLRNAGSFGKELFTGKWPQLGERVKVLTGKIKDPFDTYDWLDELHTRHGLHPLYFFLLAENNKLYDKNISPGSKHMRDLIKDVAAKYTVGIHPSWQSGDDENVLANEISLLKNITGKAVSKSRQHYIRFVLPGTYRLLIKNGITGEYSMGYGSINGFRASIASSFYWYDLERETITKLLIHPWCYMEANSYFEQHYTAVQAAIELQQYHDIVKEVSGRLIIIFHNHFVTEQPQWAAWRKMYGAFVLNNFAVCN